MNNDALIGYSGFVGGTLSGQHPFAAKFNTANIDAIDGREFDTVVCAAAPGSMFTANREPERDREQIGALIERLRRVKSRRFVLISSIAALADFGAGDDESTNAFQENLPYGRHRRELEAYCESHFENCLIVRLPALFGPGLRKNFVFDLLNPVPSIVSHVRLQAILDKVPSALHEKFSELYLPDPTGICTLNRDSLNKSPYRIQLETAVREAKMSATQFHNPNSRFQYYDVSRLWSDINVATKNALQCVHLVTEPLLASAIHFRLFGTEMPHSEAKMHREDMHTRHAGLWGRKGPYLEDANAVLNRLKEFFVAQEGSS